MQHGHINECHAAHSGGHLLHRESPQRVRVMLGAKKDDLSAAFGVPQDAIRLLPVLLQEVNRRLHFADLDKF